ncbi:MAG: AAA family ATPase, partial [Planctomycetota bacterium]
MGRVISIANQKGGVGKTTTAVNLGASLAADGRRVLIVDMDPQGNASSGCGVPVQELTSGVYDALMNGQALGEIVRSTEIDSLYVAPSNRDLAGAGLELTELEQPHFRLRDV